MPEPMPPPDAVAAVERLLHRGEPLLAFNAAQEGLREAPGHVRLRQPDRHVQAAFSRSVLLCPAVASAQSGGGGTYTITTSRSSSLGATNASPMLAWPGASPPPPSPPRSPRVRA